MKHRASKKFWHFYAELPEQIQKLADQNYELLKNDPRHPSLRLKKVGRFGLYAWAFIIGPQPCRMEMILSGSGLAITANTTCFWASVSAECLFAK